MWDALRGSCKGLAGDRYMGAADPALFYPVYTLYTLCLRGAMCSLYSPCSPRPIRSLRSLNSLCSLNPKPPNEPTRAQPCGQHQRQSHCECGARPHLRAEIPAVLVADERPAQRRACQRCYADNSEAHAGAGADFGEVGGERRKGGGPEGLDAGGEDAVDAGEDVEGGASVNGGPDVEKEGADSADGEEGVEGAEVSIGSWV